MKFGSQKDVEYLLVGVVNNMVLGCNIAGSGRIYTYKIKNSTLEFIHKTVVEDSPSAICPFHGYVLIGVGSTLRIYDFCEEMLFAKYEIEVSSILGLTYVCIVLFKKYMFIKFRTF